MKQGYAGLSALSAWGDIPESMRAEVVMPLVRSYVWNATGQMWKFGDIGLDLFAA